MRRKGEILATRPNPPPDRPLRPEQLAELRKRLSQMSITALLDAYNAAWLRCKLGQNGGAPRAEHVQQMVTVWKELRKMGSAR